METFKNLIHRQEILFWFGLTNLILALVFIWLSQRMQMEVAGANAWFKPIKFALSIWIYAWTMALYLQFIPNYDARFFSWTVLLLFGFEIFYIALQAARGQMSHFNLSSGYYHFLYMMMAFAAATVTVYTGYIGLKFWGAETYYLPDALRWALRYGFVLFVLFSFQGFAMGSRLAHAVGGPDGTAGIPFLGWSFTIGDLRIAHFAGMHALQILPLLVWLGVRDSRWISVVALVYFFVAVFVWVQAAKGISFLHPEKVLNARKAIQTEPQ
jgi:hypothetical protein